MLSVELLMMVRLVMVSKDFAALVADISVPVHYSHRIKHVDCRSDTSALVMKHHMES